MIGDKHPIIFFDGICGLCNRFVDWVIKRDRQNIYFFAPIQGETAKRFLTLLPEDISQWSIIFIDHEGVHQRSTAVLRILIGLGGCWKAMKIFMPMPMGWRDAAYNFIARRRYRWFGKRDSCRLPSVEEKERFLP
ncbi:MAG TPA: DCC1-like thiol-disulfide oxidoreductase family protein [Candidatus Omnitrophota bacterium]|nr:DCC1-like thiol-disulfide oxidoreductase family protein [Candidatus Omnitrophota bacterium]